MNSTVTAFWVCLLAFTFVSGSFLYPWAPDESFDLARHMPLSERSAMAPSEDIITVPDTWRSRRTNEVFRAADFAPKRFRQACWDTVKLVLLVIVGACFQVAATRPDGHDRREVWMWAGAVWALFTFLSFYRAFA